MAADVWSRIRDSVAYEIDGLELSDIKVVNVKLFPSVEDLTNLQFPNIIVSQEGLVPISPSFGKYTSNHRWCEYPTNVWLCDIEATDAKAGMYLDILMEIRDLFDG